MKTTTGQRLKEYMQATGIRQADIVNAVQPFCNQYGVKMNRSDISQYVAGKTEPRQEKLMLLSEALNVDVAWLMGYDVPMHPVASRQSEVIAVNLVEAEREGFFHLNDDEKSLIKAYRTAQDMYRTVALELLLTHQKL